MAQAQIDAVKVGQVDRPREIRCEIEDGLECIVKSTKQGPVLVLAKGTRRILLTLESFQRVCDLQSPLPLLCEIVEGVKPAFQPHARASGVPEEDYMR